MRLIDADELLDQFEDIEKRCGSAPWTIADIVDVVDEQQTIEAEPIKYGHWIEKPTGRYGKWQSWCSACNQHSGIGGIESNRHRPFCPNCGAKMDGEIEWKYDKS